MLTQRIRFSLIILFIAGAFSINAQQPLLRFKPRQSRVDSFDFIVSIPPFAALNQRFSLAVEMRLNKNYTFKVNSSYMNLKDPLWIDTRNLEITDPSIDEHFEEQLFLAMLKRYKTKNHSRVYFGPYIGLGIETRRTFFRMSSQVPDFEKAIFDFTSRRKSVVFAIGTTKLFSKRIIFDLYAAVKYQYKISDTGNFAISGMGYKPGWGGSFGFTIGIPAGRRKFH